MSRGMGKYNEQQLDDFKTIDLAHYIASLPGWEIMKKESTKGHVVVRNGSEKIIVHCELNGQYVYCNAHNSTDSGTIIDFVQNHILRQRNLGAVRRFLSKHDISGAKIMNEKRHKPIKKEKSFDYSGLIPIYDNTYLKSRRIDLGTLQNEWFNGTVFNMVYISRAGVEYINTAFPMWNNDGEIVAIELKNANLKKPTLPGSKKGNGFWRSKHIESKPVNNIIVTEAPIDAISFHELTHTWSQNNLYLSSCGTPTQRQFEQLMEILGKENFNSANLILAFDNDRYGAIFTFQALCYLKPTSRFASKAKININKPEVSYDISFTTDSDLNLTTVSIKIVAAGSEDGFYKLKEIESVLHSVIFPLYAGKLIFMMSEINNDFAIADVKFSNETDNWFLMCRFIKLLRFGKTDKVRIAISKSKDFNDDLKSFTGGIYKASYF